MSSPALLRSLRPLTQCSPSIRIVSLDITTPRATLAFAPSKSTKAARLQASRASAAPKAPSASTQASTTTNAAKAEVAAESTPGAQALRSGTGKVTEVEQETLPWADYLAIRKKKRRWETVRLPYPFSMCGYPLVAAVPARL